MLTYTIPLGDRNADKPDLSDREAADMAQLGFRFSEFRPELGRYRLSPSYRTLQNLDRGTLTFQQGAETAPKTPAPARPPADASLFEPGPAAAAAAAAAK